MSLDPRLVAFVGVAAVLTIVPGADMALVMRNVLALGRPRFIERLGAVLTRPAVKAWLERATGGLLIAPGVRLAWDRR